MSLETFCPLLLFFYLFRNAEIPPVGYSPFLKLQYVEVTRVGPSKKRGARI